MKSLLKNDEKYQHFLKINALEKASLINDKEINKILFLLLMIDMLYNYIENKNNKKLKKMMGNMLKKYKDW